MHKTCMTQHLIAVKSIKWKESDKYLAGTVSNNNAKLLEQRLVNVCYVVIYIVAIVSGLGIREYYHEIAYFNLL